MSFKEILKKNRPNLSDTSIRTYDSILRNLCMVLDEDAEDCKLSFFENNAQEVIKYLRHFPPHIRKLRLSALVVLTQHHDVSKKYRDLMMADIKSTSDENNKQEKTPKQKENWISQEDILKLHEDMSKRASFMMNPKYTRFKSRDDRKLFFNYLILSLYVLNPPRRLLDYTEMLMSKPKEATKLNYITDPKRNAPKKFVFNTYKTASKYGEQIVEIHPKLKMILNKWKLLNPESKYLLENQQGQKLSPSDLTKRLNSIFGRKISVNMLRHIFISEEVLKDMPKIQELQEVAREMGHSMDQQILYAKK